MSLRTIPALFRTMVVTGSDIHKECLNVEGQAYLPTGNLCDPRSLDDGDYKNNILYTAPNILSLRRCLEMIHPPNSFSGSPSFQAATNPVQ